MTKALQPEQRQYTPGPWIRSGRDEPVWPADQSIGSPSENSIVATVRFQEDGTHIANAHLIAAAPDMLAALKALVSDILEYERVNNLAPNPGKQDCWQSVTHAKAAIAKAEGRS